jgi:hypothetical protein
MSFFQSFDLGVSGRKRSTKLKKSEKEIDKRDKD